MNSIFDVKGKKKDLLIPSPFPKKKQLLKIGPGNDSGGSHLQNYFFTRVPVTEIFDTMLQEMTKFQDPIIFPESSIFRLLAMYYKVKPSIGVQIEKD
jgi:hypothetical protein